MDWWQVHNHQAKIQDGQVVETWSRVTTGQYWTWIFNDAILRERRQDLSKPVLRISQVHSEWRSGPGDFMNFMTSMNQSLGREDEIRN